MSQIVRRQIVYHLPCQRGEYPSIHVGDPVQSWHDAARDYLPDSAQLLSVDLCGRKIQFSFECSREAWFDFILDTNARGYLYRRGLLADI